MVELEKQRRKTDNPCLLPMTSLIVLIHDLRGRGEGSPKNICLQELEVRRLHHAQTEMIDVKKADDVEDDQERGVMTSRMNVVEGDQGATNVIGMTVVTEAEVSEVQGL